MFLIFTCSQEYVFYSWTEESKVAITDTKLYVPTKTLSTHNNIILLHKLKSGFERTINWNKIQ